MLYLCYAYNSIINFIFLLATCYKPLLPPTVSIREDSLIFLSGDVIHLMCMRDVTPYQAIYCDVYGNWTPQPEWRKCETSESNILI